MGRLGHSGHDTFPHVINLIARGSDRSVKIDNPQIPFEDAKNARRFAA